MKKIFLFLLICSLCFACKKDDEPTHKSWTEDDNIFRCKVNGIDWEPEGDDVGFAGGNLDIYYENFFNNGIQFLASKDNDVLNQSINMFIFVDGGITGKFNILNDNLFLDFSCGKYLRDTLAESIIDIIDIDTVNNIIEGGFIFSGIAETNSTCSSETIKITDGYFKAKYRN